MLQIGLAAERWYIPISTRRFGVWKEKLAAFEQSENKKLAAEGRPV
jgi:hypothetical protein